MADKTRRISGTLEWAVANVNCITGCEHNCRYCYARWNAVDRFKRVAHEDWTNKKVRPADVKKHQKHYDGTVMFPTTHDICPSTLDACITVISNILKADNDILIVSKPHLDCIMAICSQFNDWKERMLFRFTIGSMDDSILKYWEPGAPEYAERKACLKLAFEKGYKTSVSVEPMLDAAHVIDLFNDLKPFVTDSLWIGKMNKVRSRVKIETEDDEKQVNRIEVGQTDDKIKAIYEALKNEPKVRWKESVKAVVGLELPEEAGLDE
jgi:DNA repair photolyase